MQRVSSILSPKFGIGSGDNVAITNRRMVLGKEDNFVIDDLKLLQYDERIKSTTTIIEQVEWKKIEDVLVVVIMCLEISVVFHSFGWYLHVVPPWN